MTVPQPHSGPDVLRDLPSEFAEFFACWKACLKTGLVPTLADYLDAPPFHLQPKVSISDLHAPDDLRVRLIGTGIVDLAGRDRTGQSIEVSRDKSLGDAVKYGWAAWGHPAGFVYRITVQTEGGLNVEMTSLSLPLVPATGVPRCMVTYRSAPYKDLKPAPQRNDNRLLNFYFVGWVDIGSGVPAASAL